VADASIEAHDRWRSALADALEAGAETSTATVSATALAHDEDASALSSAGVSVESVATDRVRRPHGKRFGTLVHAVLADAPLDAPIDELRRWARVHGRLLMASDEEVAASADVAALALEHPLMRRARAAEVCHREHPLTVKRDDGRLLEGIVDLAFRESGAWVVVDFKTDLELSEESTVAYCRQVRLYCDAITSATGQPASGALLQV